MRSGSFPTDLPSRARDSFDDHFPGLRLPEDDDDDVDDDAQRIVDALRTQVDDPAALALAHGADPAAVDAIRNRSPPKG